MRQLSWIAMSSALAAAPACADEIGVTGFVEADSISWSESFPIKAFLDGFETDAFKSGGDVSFTHNQLAVGASYKSFSAAVTSRYDYYTDYSRDTARLVNDANNSGVLPGSYTLSASFKEVQATGVRLGYQQALLDTLTVEGRVSVLALQRITDGGASGTVTIDASDNVTGNAQGDYRFTDNLLFSAEYPSPGGVGFTTDLILNWSARDDINFRAAAYDIGSYLKWDDAPRTEFTADTATVTRADNGQLQVSPVLSGRDTQTDYVQRYHQRYELDGAYDLTPRTTLGLNILNIEQVTLAEARASYALTKKLRIGAQYEWQSGGVGVSVNWHGLDLQLSANSIDTDDASYAKARIGYRRQF